jgi:poly(hydroxyalkanoate) depolymerase family esterase
VGLTLLVIVLAAPPRGTAELIEQSDFGSNPGNLDMWTYVPDGLPTGTPLVVALHGCGQSAADYDDETGWIRYAETMDFALLLPEQRTGLWFGNHPLGCFNWYYRGDQGRDGDEVRSIIQMIDTMIDEHAIDPQQVYVTGLSAGGAMTAALLAAYPERFAGGAIIAGIAYGCSSVPDSVPQWAVPYWGALLGYTNPLRCLDPGVDLSPRQWGDRVRTAAGDDPHRWPVISIWHGTADRTVLPVNARELVEQWGNVHDLDPDSYRQERINGHRHRIYTNAAGSEVLELYLVEGLGHGVPIDPAPSDGSPDPPRCGTPAQYVLTAGICASFHIARRWGLTTP